MRRIAFALLSTAGVVAVFSCADVLHIIDVPDVLTGDDGGGDAAALCDPTTPFPPGTPVKGLASDGIFTITLAANQLVAFLGAGDPSQGLTLSVATRTSTSDTFGNSQVVARPTNVVTVTAAKDDTTTMVWEELTDGGAGASNSHLVLSEVTSPYGPYKLDAGTPLTGLYAGGELDPFLRADGQELYYSGFNGNGAQVFYTERDSGFQVPFAVPGLPVGIVAPVVTTDALAIYFSSNNGIQVATRKSSNDPFGARSAVIAADGGPLVYVPMLITDDRCTLYYTSHLDNFNPSDGGTSYVTTLYVTTKSQ